MLKNRRKQERKNLARYMKSFNERPSANMVYPSDDIWNEIRARYEYVAEKDAFGSHDQTLADKVKILSLDCENMVLYGRDEKAPKDQKACWVYLGNGLGSPAVEEFVRLPAYAVFDDCRRYHGLTRDDIKYACALSFVRLKCIKYIAETDVLVTVNAAADLRAIGFSSHDMRTVQRKIRDIGMYYSPRRDHQPMSLRIIAFLYFGIIIQENGKPHSPAVDATIAAWLYLYRTQSRKHTESGRGIRSILGSISLDMKSCYMSQTGKPLASTATT